jgi:hypothetical protein
VKGLGDEFFAGAAFSRDEDRHVADRELLHALEKEQDGAGFPDETDGPSDE